MLLPIMNRGVLFVVKQAKSDLGCLTVQGSGSQTYLIGLNG